MYERAIGEALSVLESERELIWLNSRSPTCIFFSVPREALAAAEEAYRVAPWSAAAADFLPAF